MIAFAPTLLLAFSEKLSIQKVALVCVLSMIHVLMEESEILILASVLVLQFHHVLLEKHSTLMTANANAQRQLAVIPLWFLIRIAASVSVRDPVVQVHFNMLIQPPADVSVKIQILLHSQIRAEILQHANAIAILLLVQAINLSTKQLVSVNVRPHRVLVLVPFSIRIHANAKFQTILSTAAGLTIAPMDNL